ncbi:Uncharacterised protein [Bordetella pertussis]|nr:Uncharacterised protein [Bordetella pertussis]
MVRPRNSDSEIDPMISETRSSSRMPTYPPKLRMIAPVARHHRKFGRLIGASSTRPAR